MSLISSQIKDTILVDDYIYSIIKWNNNITINGQIYSDSIGHSIANISDRNMSFMLLKIDKETSDIIDLKPILYEFSATTYDVSTIKIKTNDRKTKLNILINYLGDNEDTSLIVSNSGMSEYYSAITNTYNGTTLIEQQIRFKIDSVQFRNTTSQNVVIYINSYDRPIENTIFHIGDYITLKNSLKFNGDHQIENIWIDTNSNIGAIYLTIPQTNYQIIDDDGNYINYQWFDSEIVLSEQSFYDLRTTILNYETTDTIEITDIIVNNNDDDFLLGRYRNFLGDYSCFLSGTTTNYIVQTHSSTSTETGPIISTMINDEFNNIYTFGQGTNFNGGTDIQVGIFSPINQTITKSSENLAIVSKFDPEGLVLWNTVIELSADSKFDRPKIIYSDSTIYMSFNFSGSVIISSETYSTGSNQIINSVGLKIDTNTGEILKSKFLSSTKYNSIRDIKVDDDYIYFIGKMEGENHFDLVTKFTNGETGYIMKTRKIDGIVVNVIDFYSDETIETNTIDIDDENIFISGSWSGNIYINNVIKYSADEEYFITNIKKNDL